MGGNTIGIVMNGVTGRMGLNQHLVRSIVAIRAQGGVAMPDGTRLMPDPILVGRDERKLRALAEQYGIQRWSTDLEKALSNEADPIYFDATLTQVRAANVRRAIEHGKHIYCEKPLSVSTEEALDLARLADQAGVKHGVVQDKLFLPGIRKLKALAAQYGLQRFTTDLEQALANEGDTVYFDATLTQLRAAFDEFLAHGAQLVFGRCVHGKEFFHPPAAYRIRRST